MINRELLKAIARAHGLQGSPGGQQKELGAACDTVCCEVS
jgi:hypothetical protein